MTCIALKKPLELSIAERDLTISKASKGTLLLNLKKTMEEPDLVKAISFMINRACDTFNLKGNINETQAVMIAIDFLELYPYETLEDVVMMLKMARQGKLSDNVWRIDGQVILGEWMPAYLEFKSEAKENEILKAKSNQIEIETSDIPEETQKIIEDLKTKLSKPISERVKVVGTLNSFLENLPETCKLLSNNELEEEIRRAENMNALEALKIYENERELRGVT